MTQRGMFYLPLIDTCYFGYWVCRLQRFRQDGLMLSLIVPSSPWNSSNRSNPWSFLLEKSFGGGVTQNSVLVVIVLEIELSQNGNCLRMLAREAGHFHVINILNPNHRTWEKLNGYCTISTIGSVTCHRQWWIEHKKDFIMCHRQLWTLHQMRIPKFFGLLAPADP